MSLSRLLWKSHFGWAYWSKCLSHSLSLAILGQHWQVFHYSVLNAEEKKRKNKKKLQWFYLFSLTPEDVLPTLPHLQNRTEKCRSSVVWWAGDLEATTFHDTGFLISSTRISSATNVLPRAPNPRSAHSVSLSLTNYYAPMRMFLAEL